MPLDSFIKVAPDNAEGNAVDMDLVSTAAGINVRRQRAVLVGETGDLLQSIFLVQTQQLAVLRAILSTLQMSDTGFGPNPPNVANESDFSQALTPNDT